MRIFDLQVLIGKKHARHIARVNMVVSAPGLKIITKNLRLNSSGDRIPGHAIAAIIADYQIWRLLSVNSAISMLRKINLLNSRL